MSVDIDDIYDAHKRLGRHCVTSPVITSAALDQKLNARIFLKAECLQRTGSFKFRGAYNTIRQIADKGEAGDIVAYSSGNHAQGVAEAARLCGLKAHIVMPHDAPEVKRCNTVSYGARVIGYDRLLEDREQVARVVLEETDGVLVRPYDDVRVIAGQGTAGLELATELAARGVVLDALLVPCGGGGLVAGTALAFAALSPRTSIIACEPHGFDDHARSLDAGRPVPHEGCATICDALMVKQPGDITFAINQTLLSDAIAVSDDEVRTAIRFAAVHLKLVVEPGGAVGLAAILSNRFVAKGKTVAIILSGGNIDQAHLSAILAG